MSGHGHGKIVGFALTFQALTFTFGTFFSKLCYGWFKVFKVGSVCRNVDDNSWSKTNSSYFFHLGRISLAMSGIGIRNTLTLCPTCAVTAYWGLTRKFDQAFLVIIWASPLVFVNIVPYIFPSLPTFCHAIHTLCCLPWNITWRESTAYTRIVTT